MTYQEKQALVRSGAQTKIIWYFIFFSLLTVTAWSIYKILYYFGTSFSHEVSIFKFIYLFLFISITDYFLINVFILWGVYRLGTWVAYLMWLNIILSIPNFHITSFLFHLLIVFSYHYLLRLITNAKKVKI